MIVGHGHSPVRHAALRIFLYDTSKSIVGLLVPKGMEHRDRTVEFRLSRWLTRNWKGHLAKFRWVASGMVMLGNC
jgi:hypothetical protein